MNSSPLRQRMLDELQMRGYSPRTVESYIGAVADLCRYSQLPPDKIAPQQIQAWLLWQVKEKKLSASTCRQRFNGVRFLFHFVLKDEAFDAFSFTLPKTQQRIPELLSRKEVSLLLSTPGNLAHRLLLSTCYGCGLRLSELVQMKPQQIDAETHLLHVVQIKGRKDRLVPIPPSLLIEWRRLWYQHRSPHWLFPITRGETTAHLSERTPQRLFARTKRRIGITKHGGIHALRHAFATHALSSGMPIHQLQRILGHKDVRTTTRYLHWLPEKEVMSTRTDLLQTLPPLNQ